MRGLRLWFSINFPKTTNHFPVKNYVFFPTSLHPGTSPVSLPNTCVPVCRPSWATCLPTSMPILRTRQPPPRPQPPPPTALLLPTSGWVHQLFWPSSSGITEVWCRNVVQDLANYCSSCCWATGITYLPTLQVSSLSKLSWALGVDKGSADAF